MRRTPLVLLVLLALLCLAPTARALTVPGPAGLSLPELLASPAEEPEESEAEASEEEGIEAEEECEEEEPGECDEDASGPEAPAECLLSTVRPTAFASASKVRLQIRYTATAPSPVKVDYGLHGAKGSLFLGSERKRFGKQGTLQLSRKLTESQMAKVLAARDFTVRLRVLAAPRWCGSYFDRHLTVRRATPRGLTWLQSE